MSSTSSSSSAQSRAVTCSAPSNIAVIKYWGKRDAELNLPLNSSVSLTFDQDVLRTVTTVTASAELSEDSLWLNDKCVSGSAPHGVAPPPSPRRVQARRGGGQQAAACCVFAHARIGSQALRPAGR